MKKFLPLMAAMAHEFMPSDELTKKVKAANSSEFGFKSTHGKTVGCVSPRDLSGQLGVSARTLQRWRQDGSGPAFIKTMTGQILYPLTELDKWVKANLKTQESPETSGVTNNTQGCNNGEG